MTSRRFQSSQLATSFSACGGSGELKGRRAPGGEWVSNWIACACVRAWGRCADFLRLYLDVDVSDALTAATPASYELCGNISSIPMKQFYSSRQVLAMRFHSDPVRGNQTGFRGIYRFVDRGRSVSLFTEIVVLGLLH